MHKFSSRSPRRLPRDDVAGCLPYDGPDALSGDNTVPWPRLMGEVDFPRGTHHPNGHDGSVQVSETHPITARVASQKSKRERRF